MHKVIGRRHTQKGSTLLFVSIFGLIILVGIASLLSMGIVSMKSAHAMNNKILANNLAEAGVNRATAVLGDVVTNNGNAYYKSGFTNLSNADFASYASGTFASNVNGGANTSRMETIRTLTDGSYQLARLLRLATDKYTIGAVGQYVDRPTNKTYKSDIEVDVQFQFQDGGAAIISDMSPPNPDTGSGKGWAQNGNVQVSKANIMGGIIANGEIGISGSNDQLTNTNAESLMNNTTYPPNIQAKLDGTAQEVPDYTNPGSNDQLFDFGRLIAACDAGAGTHFTGNNSMENFTVAARAGTLKGIIVVDVNPLFVDAKGNGSVVEPHFKIGNPPDSIPSSYNIPSGHAITVQGTLIFNIATSYVLKGVTKTTDPLFKVWGEAPLSLNAIQPAGGLTADQQLANYESAITAYKSAVASYISGGQVGDPPAIPTPPTGYPSFGSPGYTGPNPWDVDISGKLDSNGVPYKNFSPADDFPAVMYNTGILDIHSKTDICGALYTPSFVEIENKQDEEMYFCGTIIAGGGVYTEDGSTGYSITVAYDANATNNLITNNLDLKTPRVVAWRQNY